MPHSAILRPWLPSKPLERRRTSKRMQEIEGSCNRRKTSAKKGGISSRRYKSNRAWYARRAWYTIQCKIVKCNLIPSVLRCVPRPSESFSYFWTSYAPSKTRIKKDKLKLNEHLEVLPRDLPPEWIQIKVLRSPGSPRNWPPMHKTQHPKHPVLPLHKEKDVAALIHHHQVHQVQQQPTKIIAVSVWRICRWMPAYLHACHAAEKQCIFIAKTIFLEVVWVENRRVNVLIAK